MGSFLSRFIEWHHENPKKALVAFILLVTLLRRMYAKLRYNNNALRNKIVLITGGAMGIGKLVALKCKKEGASKVIVWDINEAELTKLREAGSVDMAEKVDVTDRECVMNAASKVLSEYGKIDILINNAGIVSGKPLLQLTERDVRTTFDVNVISHFWTLQAFLPVMMKKNSGHIVTISSSAGRTGVSYLTDYCASKFACRGLDDAIRHELQDLGYNGIKFTCICPYFINTGMFAGAKAARNRFVGMFVYFLTSERVRDEIIDSIKQETRELILPYRLGFLYYLEPILPYFLVDYLIVNSANMTNFTGRSLTSRSRGPGPAGASNSGTTQSNTNVRTMGLSTKELGMEMPS